MPIYKQKHSLTDGSIPKRSASKKLSEPGRYKDRSHNFFMQKFWIVSILNTDKSGMLALHKLVQRRVFCSTSFKLNRIDSLLTIKT